MADFLLGLGFGQGLVRAWPRPLPGPGPRPRPRPAPSPRRAILSLRLLNGVDAGQEHRPEAGHDGHGGQRPGGQFGRRRDAQVFPQADGPEGHPRDIEPVGAAHFVLAVNVVQVAAREGVDALPGDLDQVGAFAVDQGLHRAGAHAARHRQLARGDLRVAQGALHDPGGQGLVVLEGRNLEGAGNHAVAAAHADRAVPGDRALRRSW